MSQNQPDSDWGIRLKNLERISTHLRYNGALGDALRMTQNFLDSFQRSDLQTRLQAIQSDYDLLAHYYVGGLVDPKRNEVYQGLVTKLYKLLADIENSYEERNSQLRISHQKWKTGIAFDVEEIRQKLEAYVSDVALCSLEPEQTRAAKLRTLQGEHHSYMQMLFDAMIYSYQWSAEMATAMGQLLASPTIDTADAQLLTTALMMTGLCNCDPERVRTLIYIYEHTQDINLKERALVGWALAINDAMTVMSPQIGKEVDRLLSDPAVREEVMEMQMQMIFCRNAKQDNETLKKDIMPSLLKNSDIQMTAMGIKPKEDDPMDDIMNPEAADKKMEEVEASIKKMNDMQKQGADIYFGGFSQMKRYSFFYTLINWFLPFNPYHPQIQHVPQELLKSDIVKMLTKSSTFCESDKYSFVLGISTIYHQLPQQVKEALNMGPVAMGMAPAADVDNQSPSYVRRMYLQDLYRFFTLCDERRLFAIPFDDTNFLFITQGVFVQSMHAEARRVERLLYKQQQYNHAFTVLAAYQEVANVDDLRMQALLCTRFERYYEAAAVYERLVDLQPDNTKNYIGAAQANFHDKQYEEAAKWYELYYEKEPAPKGSKLNYCIALLYSNQAEKSTQELFRLHYEHPEDQGIKRALAFGLLHVGRTDQASKLYESMLAETDCNEADYLNAAYCKWFMGKIENAIDLLCQSMEKREERVTNIDDILEIMHEDSSLLLKYGIGHTEQCIVADQCLCRLKA